MNSLVDDSEAESHVGAGITIRHRENIYLVDVLPTLKKALYGSGQTVHHPGGINIGNSLGQNFKPANEELNKYPGACQE